MTNSRVLCACNLPAADCYGEACPHAVREPCQCKGLNCGECRKTIPFPTNAVTQPLLRELRLWHWKQHALHTSYAQHAASGRYAQREAEEAAFHMQAVQTLNDFFAIGDTAERDHALAEHSRLSGELQSL